MNKDCAPVTSVSSDNVTDELVALVRRAGKAIIEVSGSVDLGESVKADWSPVTEADRRANRILCNGLAAMSPSLPIVSEESELPSWRLRRQWSKYWLVDPLDGTREFLLGSDEFTVNVALIEQGLPVLGVILQPVSGDLYFGRKSPQVAFKEDAQGSREPICSRKLSLAPSRAVEVFVSRHYGEQELKPFWSQLQERYGSIELKRMGSSLKFCRLAEGKSDLYCRLAPTCEWDTGAGQAILEAAGGGMYSLHGSPFIYNSKPDLINGPFFAVGDVSQPWRKLIVPLNRS